MRFFAKNAVPKFYFECKRARLRSITVKYWVCNPVIAAEGIRKSR
jgi:hypothetical protein